MDVTLHEPNWVEDNSLSSDKYIVFRCQVCHNNTTTIKRADWDKGKMPSLSKHFPR